MNRKRILNVEIDSISQKNLLKQLKKGVLVTPNVDQIVKMQSDKEYYQIVQKAE
jgi:UDP-N-acetyl-D-mannosaminuronic acid transferase (WecB/TagA/CpsF family)